MLIRFVLTSYFKRCFDVELQYLLELIMDGMPDFFIMKYITSFSLRGLDVIKARKTKLSHCFYAKSPKLDLHQLTNALKHSSRQVCRSCIALWLKSMNINFDRHRKHTIHIGKIMRQCRNVCILQFISCSVLGVSLPTEISWTRIEITASLSYCIYTDTMGKSSLTMPYLERLIG